VKAFLAVMALRLLTLATGIDHVTTLDTWSNPICTITGVGSATAFIVLAARNYFAPPAGTVLPERWARLKKGNFLLWSLQGIAATAVIAVLAGWCSAALVGVAAQYLDGSEASFEATVLSVDSSYSARGVCRERVRVRRESDAVNLTICLVTRYRPSIATGLLQAGMPVTVHIVDTALGPVVRSVEPSRS
jgi:hypothetical protein